MVYGEIVEYIKKGSNKLSLREGEIYRLKFIDAEVVTGKYGKQVAIEWVDMEDNEKKKMYTSSQKLLKRLFTDLKIESGEVVTLRKTGDRFETVFFCDRVKFEPASAVSADEIKQKKKEIAKMKKARKIGK